MREGVSRKCSSQLYQCQPLPGMPESSWASWDKGPEMKPEAEWPSLTLEQLLEEYRERDELIEQKLVGWLYPSILRDEMARIEAIYKKHKYG